MERVLQLVPVPFGVLYAVYAALTDEDTVYVDRRPVLFMALVEQAATLERPATWAAVPLVTVDGALVPAERVEALYVGLYHAADDLGGIYEDAVAAAQRARRADNGHGEGAP